MKCDTAQQNMVLAGYGELHDEQIDGLEEHLSQCASCRMEWNELKAFEETMALHPLLEPSPNLLAQARLKLDEELDQIPAHGLLTRIRGLFFGTLATMQGAPALTTLLFGVGFLGGNFTYRFQVAHAPKPPRPVVLMDPTNGVIANVSGIVQTPNSEIVQVKYNRVVPETIEGSLDDPEIRKLLLMGLTTGTTSGVRENSVSLLASECQAGHRCSESGNSGANSDGIRSALLVSLRYDKSPAVRLKALAGLQPYVSQDQHVRDAVLESLMNDPNSSVRSAAIGLLQPVQSDSSVRQVLRTVSAQDNNPYIRTASYQALQDASDIQ
jgi:HEAT repeats